MNRNFDLGFNLRDFKSRFQLFATAGVGAPASAGTGGDGGGGGAGAGTGGGTGGGSGAGSGTGTTGTGGSAGSPSAAGTGTGSPSSGQGGNSNEGPPASSSNNGNDANIAVLRQSHQFLSERGGPEAVRTAVERYTAMHNTAADLAQQLGYTKESFEDAFSAGPAEIYNHLMAEARALETSRGNGQPEDVRTVLNRELAPIRQVIQRQWAREANAAVDGEFNRLLGDHALFKGKAVADDVKTFVYNHFTDLVKNDQAVQAAILQGDVKGLQQYFDKAIANVVSFTNGWQKWTTGQGTPAAAAGQGAGTGQGQGQGGEGGRTANPFSLDDIIEGNDNATKAMPSLRGFR